MVNLITQKQKKTVRLEYSIRLISTSLFVPISLLGFFLLAYLVPYYIAVKSKDLWVAEQFNSVIKIENKEKRGPKFLAGRGQTLEELNAIEFYNKNSLAPSIYFGKIIANKNPSIIITKLSFTGIQKNQGLFLVNGVSQNREGLVSFIEALRAVAGFVSVESPISDFAKESNISFTLNIKVTI